jgi:hypothetical protein
VLVTVSSLFQPTSSTLIAFQNPNSSIPPRTTADNAFAVAVQTAFSAGPATSLSRSSSPPHPALFALRPSGIYTKKEH